MSVSPVDRTSSAGAELPTRPFEGDASGVDPRYARKRGEMRRPCVRGKFLFVDDEHFWIRGVTYGTFKPDAAGLQFPEKDIVERDFGAMADAGLNAVRVY